MFDLNKIDINKLPIKVNLPILVIGINMTFMAITSLIIAMISSSAVIWFISTCFLAFLMAGSIYIQFKLFVEPLAHLKSSLEHISTTGQFEPSIKLIEKNEIEEFTAISKNLNSLMSQIQLSIANVSDNVSNIIDGNYLLEVLPHEKDDLKKMTLKINQTMSVIDQSIQQINSMLKDVSEGQLSQRVESNVKGDLKLMQDYINQLLNDLEASLIIQSTSLQNLIEGKFDFRIDDELNGEHNQIKQLLNDTITSINDAMQKTIYSVIRISDLINILRSNSQNNASNVNIQSSAMELVTSHMEIADEMVRLNTEKAINAYEIASRSIKELKEGEGMLQTMVVTIEDIAASTDDIRKTSLMINDIAHQTHMLSLNARIEAARSSSENKGFMAVANEVQKLSERSTEVTQETQNMINITEEKVRLGVKEILISTEKLTGIMHDMSQVEQLIGEIKTGGEEQCESIHSVNTELNEVNHNIQMGCRQSLDLAEDVESLEVLTSGLRKSLSVFTLRPVTDKNEQQVYIDLISFKATDFGKVAIEMNFVEVEELVSALADQQTHEDDARIGEILQQKGVLSLHQVDLILQETQQRKNISQLELF
ncbi:MAG: hypothetical protein HON94_15065 [Methylococcales bacterium]|jgi:methyl-accepting chemotaxis protein|nr:hypothetical protein [Methylococcales bacterium]MBT7410376.1 hypothetical protein [Methylococcales bacterium]